MKKSFNMLQITGQTRFCIQGMRKDMKYTLMCRRHSIWTPVHLSKTAWKKVYQYIYQTIYNGMQQLSASRTFEFKRNKRQLQKLWNSGLNICDARYTVTTGMYKSGIRLGLCLANESRRYNVTSSLTGWAHILRMIPANMCLFLYDWPLGNVAEILKNIWSHWCLELYLLNYHQA